MQQYDLVAPNRCCARTGRALKPGERVFSVLFNRAGTWERKEIAVDAWVGPPPDAFSFWRTVVPDEQSKGPRPLDTELLWDCFVQLDGRTDPKQSGFRYILALLLLRKKRLKLGEIKRIDEAEWLVLKDDHGKQTLEVLNPQLDALQLVDLQRELEALIQ